MSKKFFLILSVVLFFIVIGISQYRENSVAPQWIVRSIPQTQSPDIHLLIKGGDEFKKKTKTALEIFQKHSPADFEYVQRLIRIIWNLRASGTNSLTREISISDIYANTDPVRYALTILHEACHIQVCQDKLFQCQGSSREEERYCLFREKEAFERIPQNITTPPYLAEYYTPDAIEKLLDSKWWEIPYSARNY